MLRITFKGYTFKVYYDVKATIKATHDKISQKNNEWMNGMYLKLHGILLTLELCKWLQIGGCWVGSNSRCEKNTEKAQTTTSGKAY